MNNALERVLNETYTYTIWATHTRVTHLQSQDACVHETGTEPWVGVKRLGQKQLIKWQLKDQLSNTYSILRPSYHLKLDYAPDSTSVTTKAQSI